jgi:hypothetical protein
MSEHKQKWLSPAMQVIVAMTDRLTSPDKHDRLFIALGDRVRVAEFIEEDGQAAVKAGETSLTEFKHMLTLPMSHDRLGLVRMLVGQGSDNNCDGGLAAFICVSACKIDPVRGVIGVQN